LLPIPTPAITPIPEYGTYEVRGTAASETASEGTLNLSTLPIIWDPQNFAGFYYDLNYNLGNEELQILQPDLSSNQRNIAKGNLVYRTSAQPKMLNVVKYAFGGNIFSAATSGLERTASGQAFEGGNYYILGWQGEKYVALNGKVDRLARLILEQGTSAADKKTLAIGETWDIGDNWTITLQSIDVRSTPRMAWLVLGREGIKKDDIFVSSGTFGARSVYTYVEKNISNETDVPLFVTYLDSVFAGATTDMVQLRYTWLISTSINEIKNSNIYGKFKDATVNGRTISLNNSDSMISLSRDTTVDLIGNIKFKVADNETLRFIPLAVHSSTAGIYEIRGTSWNETPISGFGGTGRIAVWNVSNFAGFYYDNDNNLGKEELHLLQTDLSSFQRTIRQNNLVYSTKAQPKMLNVVKYAFGGNVPAAEAAGLERTAPWQAFEGGNYHIVAWQGEKYVALNGMVHKITRQILEQGTYAADKKTLTIGETWDVGGGWSLTVKSINVNSTPRTALLELRKDGVKKDERSISAGTSDAKPVYTYAEYSIAGESNVPAFVTYVDSIFAGATADLLQLRYTWAISTEITTIQSGDKFGLLTVVDMDVANKRLGLKNSDIDVNLNQNDVGIMGNLKFKVKCDGYYWNCYGDVLRFMPVIVRYVDNNNYPPGGVTYLRAISQGPDYIKWAWNDPTDPDFDHVQVYIDGTFKNNVPIGTQVYNATGFARYTVHTIATRTVDNSGNINPNWVNHTTWTELPTPAPVSPPESRYVWDASLGSNLTYTWKPMNFDGFYYDLDNNIGNESLTIRLDSNISRNIQQNNLRYSTIPETVSFKYKPFGEFSVIGFMSEKYFAGYSTGIASIPISSLSYGQLHKVLTDDDTQRAVYAGSTITLGEGYVLKVNDVKISNEVSLSLLKDGAEVDNALVSPGVSYVYSKNIGSINDFPIIAVRIDNIFRGSETNAAFIKGIFQ
ncbi:MAG: S-layer protein domain-containing protein, partial [Candidatus Methanoperedens sp.]|nr:S-layer protein domain-containing protein [Candidatus Methanoperedens sp.]